MTPVMGFWVSAGSYGIAALVALVGDFLGIRRPAAVLSGLVLAAGGVGGLVFAWTSTPSFVYDAFVVGAGFSVIPALAGVLGGLAVMAEGESGDSASAQRAALMALAVLGASLTAQAADLVTLVIALEIAAVSAYAIVASRRNRRSYEAAFKYFLQGSVATGILLLGIAVFAGTIDPAAGYIAINAAIGSYPRLPALFGLTLVVAALAFKAGAAPFHAWVPDAYESSPPAGAAVLSGAVKGGAVAALCAVSGAIAAAAPSAEAPYGVLGGSVFPVMGLLAVVSIVVGSLAALRQVSYVRMLGYAGVAQVGYALIALSSSSPEAALIAIATYSVAATGAFLVAHVVERVDPEWDGTIAGMRGLSTRNPLLAVWATFFMVSMAGIPPLVGFWGKFQVFVSAVSLSSGYASQGMSGQALWYAVLTAVGATGAIVSVAYYGRVVRSVFEAAPGVVRDKTPFALSRVAVAVLGIAVLVLGLVPLLIPAATVISGFLM